MRKLLMSLLMAGSLLAGGIGAGRRSFGTGSSRSQRTG